MDRNAAELDEQELRDRIAVLEAGMRRLILALPTPHCSIIATCPACNEYRAAIAVAETSLATASVAMKARKP